MLNHQLNAHGSFTPTAVASPKYDKPGTGNTLLSLSAGVEWGDRLLSPPSSNQPLYFIYGNRNSKELSIQKKLSLLKNCNQEKILYILTVIFTMTKEQDSYRTEPSCRFSLVIFFLYSLQTGSESIKRFPGSGKAL